MTTAPREQLPDHARLPDTEPVPRVRGRARTTPPWWFALPAVVLFAFVVLVPSVRGVYYAFTDWDVDPHFSLVGLANFSELLRDPDATQAIWHTLLIALSITETYESPYGDIRSEWQVTDGGRALGYDVVVPANSEATLRLPVVSADSVREGRVPLACAEGVCFIGCTDGV
ncbi:alpha-L-rhamnosidase C-terminal domain-containing protein [Streptomyces sp. QTS52]